MEMLRDSRKSLEHPGHQKEDHLHTSDAPHIPDRISDPGSGN